MTGIAVSVLWFLVGLIILCGIVYLAIWVIEQFIMPIPQKVKQGIWVIVLLLALIALITAIAGGGGFRSPFGHMKASFQPSLALHHFPLTYVRGVDG